MAVIFTPQISFLQQGSIIKDKNQSKTSNPIVDREQFEPPEKPKSSFKHFLANVSYAWINLSEMVKGLFKGLFSGFVAGTIVAGFDMITSGYKQVKNKKIKPLEIFKPEKAMSKMGRRLAPITAAVVFVGKMIIARLEANKRTANVDHLLYEGHRDK